MQVRQCECNLVRTIPSAKGHYIPSAAGIIARIWRDKSRGHKGHKNLYGSPVAARTLSSIAV
jgi:hypothetical protein